MKKLISILLICALLALSFTGCDRQSSSDNENTVTQDGNFAPEATAISPQTNTDDEDSLAALMDLQTVQTEADTQEAVAADPTVSDVAITAEASEPVSVETTPETVDAQPFTTATPQPNTAITSYSEISGTGLGFKFSYPTDWNNIPGRSTVCYVQPLENGTSYPARVAVTMKTLAHKCTEEKAQTELAEYIKLLMTQYDESTFEVNKDLDSETKFMGSKALSTTYLAYDGNQEIQGYVILTWFEKYVFCYHFLCAYEDYAAFDTAMRHMRDSVQPVQSDFDTSDD